jgi:predicted transcriptional regulator
MIMDLSFLIPSKVRRTILQYWVENPDGQMGVRELARELKISPQQTLRELCNLESWGLLFSSRRGTERAFRLNQRFRLYSPIRDLFMRYREEQNRKYEVNKTYKMEDLVREIGKTPIPPEMIPRLMEKRKKPRSYEEEKLLKRIG